MSFCSFFLFVDRCLFDFGDAHRSERLIHARLQKHLVRLRGCFANVDLLLLEFPKPIDLSFCFTFLYLGSSLVMLSRRLLAHCERGLRVVS